jgi:hypothetical protein
MKKIIYPLALLIFLALPFTTCDLINDLLEDDENTTEQENTYDLYTNPGDPTLMKATNSDGTEVMLFGTKDAEGAPEKVDMISVQYPDDNSSYKIMVREDGTPGKIYTTEGSVFEFEPINEKEFFMTVVSKTGEIRISTKINLDSLEKSTEAFGTGRQYSFIRSSDENYPALFQPSEITEVLSPSANRNGNKLTLNLTKCGHPYTSALFMPVLIMKPPAGKEVFNVPSVDGIGQYSYMLPDPSLPSTQIQKTCNKIGKAIDKLCLAATWAPGSISTLIKMLVQEQFPNATDKASITKVADKVTKLVPQLCKIKDEVNVADFCELVGEVYLNPNPDQYQYTLVGMIPGDVIFIPADFNPNTGGIISYDIPGVFNVFDLYTNPKDPGPIEGYTAVASVICPDPQGTVVTISVTGSDGYTNSNTITVTADGDVTLYVPGGAQSVKDVITVTANGKTWSTYIVF